MFLEAVASLGQGMSLSQTVSQSVRQSGTLLRLELKKVVILAVRDTFGVRLKCSSYPTCRIGHSLSKGHKGHVLSISHAKKISLIICWPLESLQVWKAKLMQYIQNNQTG